MAAIIQIALMRVALCGLAVSLVLLALRSRIARASAARLLSAWRGLTAFGRAAVCAFLLVGILVGGDKTNSPPQNLNMPMGGGGVPLTGLGGVGEISSSWRIENSAHQLQLNAPTLSPVQTTPVQNGFAQRKAANWNVRGAWKDSFWLPFEDGWVFPWGTNHMSGVEVVSFGQIWPTPFDTNAVASAGVPFEIVRGLTTFGYEFTPSNSYRFVWTDAAVNRDTNNLMTASVELMRCGDVAVTTNGVAALLPRELPFAHDGFGQDAEWVTANFTNATEIAAAGGYAAWVDAQVGEGLTNGLYKLTVSLTNPPPEVVNLTVGDWSVAVTNVGEYVFLLEKSTWYEIGLSYFMDGFSFDCDDGLELAAPSLLRGPVNSPACSVLLASSCDEGGVELVEPSPSGDGYVVYSPWLSLAPSEAVDPTFPLLLSASVFDLPQGAYPTVEWQTNNATIDTGENFFWYGDEDVDAIDVVVTCRDATLHGRFSIERHVRTSEITLSGGGLIIVEDAYTNAPGEIVAASSTSAGLDLSWSLAEEGTLSLESDCAALALTNEYGTALSLPHSWHGSMDEEDESRLFVSCTNTTQTGHVGDFVFTFTPDAPTEATLVRTVGVDVVKIRVEADAAWPSNRVRHVFGPQETFRVVSNPQVSLSLDMTSPASVSGNTVTAPDTPCAFPVTATVGSASVSLPFSCIEPTGIEAVSCAAFAAQDWATNKTARPTVGCVAVGMTLQTRFMPDYVSFSHLFFQESGSDATDRWGVFSDHANTLAPHDFTNGAWSEVAVGVENSLPTDYATASFGVLPYIEEDSGFQYNITNYWYIKIGNSPGVKRSFGVESQVYVLTVNGDLSVEKYGCIATRDTNDVTTITRR